MFEQGRSTLPTGEDGRILDRLAGLVRISHRRVGRANQGAGGASVAATGCAILQGVKQG